jgi:hypothetical protein
LRSADLVEMPCPNDLDAGLGWTMSGKTGCRQTEGRQFHGGP